MSLIIVAFGNRNNFGNSNSSKTEVCSDFTSVGEEKNF